MHTLQGNVVTPQQCGYGTLTVNGDKLEKVQIAEAVRPEVDWLLPGFIDLHLHGLGLGEASVEHADLMADFAPRVGVTMLCPAMGSDTPEKTLRFVTAIRDLTKERKPQAAFIAGSHLEGPYLDEVYGGGMDKTKLRLPDMNEVEQLLAAAQGTLKIMTIAPELPGAEAVIRRLVQAGVQVSAGHTALQPQDLSKAVEAGVRQICHLFDAYAGREVVGGVSIPCLVDMAMINDHLMLEMILDGHHVPAELVQLAIRAAGVDRVIGITDAMRGTGLPDAEYPMTDGRLFTLTNGDVCRLKDKPAIIVGSCLTMNRAFKNLLELFHVSPVEAVKITSSNAARVLKLEQVTGSLQPGLRADMVRLASDCCTVKETIIAGARVYER